MSFRYWLSLFGFVSVIALGGLLRNILPLREEKHTFCDDNLANDISRPHSFLCGQKIKIKEANISELSSIRGISQKKARRIREFIGNNPDSRLNDLVKIRGIGPRMVERLKEYFL